MLVVPEEIKEIFRKDNLGSEKTRRKWKLRFFDTEIQLLFPEDTLFPSDDLFPIDQEPVYVIENKQMITESMTLTESLCESDDLMFGECNAAQFEVTVADVLLDLAGKEFMATVEVGEYEMAMGIYTVDSFVRQADKRFKKITAYDRMRKFQTDVAAWYNGLGFPISLRNLRNSLCDYIGVKQVITNLPLDDMMIAKTIEPEQLFGIDVLRAICEINGCFGHMDKTGRLKYQFLPVSSLFPSEELYPDEDLYPSSMNQGESETLSHYKQSETKYEDYVVQPIVRLQIRQEEGDIGLLYGPPGNTYVIQGNFLVYGKNYDELLQIAAAAYEAISGRIYRPCRIVVPALPWVEVGDGLVCFTTDDVIETYCLKRTMKGIQGMMDTYEATGSIELEENFGIHTQIIQLEGKAAVIKKNVDEVSVRLTDLKEYTEAQLKVVANEILAEVKRAQESEAALSLKADQISMHVTNLEKDTNSKFLMTSEQIALKVSIGDVTDNLNSELKIEGHRIELTTGNFIINAKNLSVDETGNAIFGGKIKGAELEGTLISSSEMFSVMDDGANNYEIDCGGFAFYESGRVNIFADMIDETVGMADSGVVRLWIGGNYDNPETYFDERGEMYPGDSWWSGRSLTRTVKSLWDKVFSGGGCSGDCSSDGGCDDGCDDGGCNSQDLVDDIGGC